MIASIGLFLSAMAVSAAQPRELVLPEATPIPAAAWPLPGDHQATLGSETLRFKDGQIVGRVRQDGGWLDATSRPVDANASPIRIRVVLVTRTSVLVPTTVGPEIRRGNLEQPHLANILMGLSRTRAMLSGLYGRPVQFDLIADPVWHGVERDQAFGKEWLNAILGPALNFAPFPTEGQVAPGPYAAAWVIHPALRNGVEFHTVRGTPVASLPYHTLSTGLHPHAFEASLIRAFAAQQKLAYTEAEAPTWEPFDGDAPATTLGTTFPIGQRWVALGANSALPGPRINTRTLAAMAGEEDVVFAGEGLPGMLGQFGAMSLGGQHFLFARPGYEDLVTVRWPAATVVGHIKDFERTDRVLIVFRLPEQAMGLTDAEILGLNLSADRTEPAATPRAWGYFSVVPKAGTADAFTITRTDPYPRGEVVLGTLNAAQGVVRMNMRFETPEDRYALHIYNSEGNLLGEVLLTGQMSRDLAANGGDPIQYNLFVQRVPVDGEWHEVKIPLSQFPGAQEIRLGATSQGQLQPRPQGPCVVEFTRPTVVPEDAPMATLPRYEPPARPWQGVDETQLEPIVRSILGGQDATLWPWALEFLAQFPLDDGVALIGRKTTDPNPLIHKLAIQALMEQPNNTEAMRALIAPRSPGSARSFAATTFAGKWEATDIPQLGQALGESTWWERYQPTKAIQQVGGLTADAILGVMLQDPDHAVRHAVVDGWVPSTDLGWRRILFAAVNDPSEAVRETSRIQLLKAPTPELVAEGLAGVNDESPWVRAAMLKQLAVAEHRDKFVRALRDPHPMVQVSALEALLASEQGPKVEEIRHLFVSGAPDVVAAVVQVLQANKAGLTDTDREQLRANPVRTLAAAIQQITEGP